MTFSNPLQIAAEIEKSGNKGLPPVHDWNPTVIGEIDIRIARDGVWYHEGSPINRKRLVKLFASVLLREGEEYFLVTPVEKLKIVVEDVPFLAVWCDQRVESGESKLVFRTSLDDEIIAGPVNPIRVDVDPQTREPAPYIRVRDNLEALISRPVFYQLVELAEEREVDGESCFGVESSGEFFVLDRAGD